MAFHSVVSRGAFATTKFVNKFRGWLSPPPIGAKEQLVAYANNFKFPVGYQEAQIINEMKLVGLEEMRAVAAFECATSVLKEKMRAELVGKRVPEIVTDSILAGIEGVKKYTNSWEEFAVDPAGTGHIFKTTLIMSLNPQDDSQMQVAMAVSGAKFNAAKEVAYTNKETVPVYEPRVSYVQTIESGFFGDYKVPRKIETQEQVGTRTLETPIFKERAFGKADLEVIKLFLEGKALNEAIVLYGCCG
ncbi:unnamed protein product [Effrenium voratum]|uniref:Uncharacterized protein n=1 Tax=Effrenium voratum TaxID=2562239 RepID=A0AA36N215_9DINO|nr:unnamed protein product [Effrenium voratum]CAJ1433480.1 unnamed protein product [Effrenium voratum]